MSCGIYKITNKILNKHYIGRSIHIEDRWKEHIRGKGSSLLFTDFQKYGLDNFSFEIIELCTEDIIHQRERYWIEYYGSFVDGYNKNDGGDNSIYATAQTKKPIYCYNLNGEFIKKYESLSDAERDTGISNSNISRAAKTKGRTKNYLWTYVYHENISPYERYLGDVGKNSGKTIYQFDKQMNFIQEFVSAKEAERITGINNSSINQVCNKKRKSAGGYIWKFKEEIEEDKCIK